VILSDLSDFVRSDKFPTVQVKVGQTRQQPYKVVCPVRFPVRFFCLFFFIGKGPEEGGKLQDHLSRWIVLPVRPVRSDGPDRITKGICELELG
jgi:hypothetical protein